MTEPAGMADRPRPPRSLVRAIGLTFAGQGMLVVLSAMSGILTARLLHPDGKGQFTTAVIAAGVLALLIELGLRTAMIRPVAAGRASWKEAAATLITVYGALCLLLLPLVFLLLWLFQARIAPVIPLRVLLLALAGVPLGLVEGSLMCALSGNQRQPEVSGLQAAEKGAAVLGMVALVWLSHLGVLGAVLAQLGGTLAGILGAWLILARLPGGVARVRLDLLPELFRFGRVVYISNLASSLNYRLDALLVFAFLGPTAAGYYATGVGLAEMTQYLPASIAAVLLPSVSGDATGAEWRTARLSRFTLFVTLVANLLIAALGYPLIALLYGPAFLPAYPALVVLLPGMLLLAQSKLLAANLVGRGLPQYAAGAAWTALLFTVALDLLLIPRWGLEWGILGAAVASTVAYTISDLVIVHFYRRATGVRRRSLFLITPAEIGEIGRRLAWKVRTLRG